MRDFAISDDAAVQAQLDRLAVLSVPQGRLGLATITALLERLGNPQRALPPVFHVAGTNGKGSVCAFLRAMLEAEGYNVHATISPHLVRYNERIRLAGALISDADLAAILAEVLDASEEAGEELSPSFFEVTIAAAFLAFARAPADACVVEVGLGGRFDATNVLEAPAVCGIAALGLDHEKFLLAPEAGTPDEPMARIAFEKAGIAKAGVPLVTQDYASLVAAEIVRRAALAGSPLAMRGRDWSSEAGTASIIYRDKQGTLGLPPAALPGAHQSDNAALAVAMVRHQQALPISDAAIAKGLQAARWPARLQWLSPGPLTDILPGHEMLLDGGHNPDAAAALKTYLASAVPRPIHAVMGMLSSKDAAGFLQAVAPLFATFTALPIAGHDHIAPEHLAQLAQSCGAGRTEPARDLAQALKRLSHEPRNGGTIFLGGSLYFAGEVLRANREFPD